ncbi:Uncharacterised protein [Bacteroides xylanisolvens]|nr:Uncharacterised protein [Bacteroides xylanisolvens]
MHRKVFIQMIHERHTGRYIHAGDLFIRDPLEVLSERADGIPMGVSVLLSPCSAP